MNVMFDINVVLDIVARREPFCVDSEAAYLKTIENADVPCLSAHAYSTLYYLLGAAATRKQRDGAMDWVFNAFHVAGVTATELYAARQYSLPDFEDAIVVAAAASAECGCIVTRNVQHFKGAVVKAVLPSEYVRGSI